MYKSLEEAEDIESGINIIEGIINSLIEEKKYKFKCTKSLNKNKTIINLKIEQTDEPRTKESN